MIDEWWVVEAKEDTRTLKRGKLYKAQLVQRCSGWFAERNCLMLSVLPIKGIGNGKRDYKLDRFILRTPFAKEYDIDMYMRRAKL